MNQICIECNSDNLQKKGIRLAGKTRNLAYKCNDCGEEFSVPYNNEPEEIIENDDLHYIRDEEYISSIISKNRIVFTTALNNTPINKRFYNSLQQYCNHNDASFVVFPIRYKNPSLINTDSKVWYPSEIVPYLSENKIDILPNLKALGGLKPQATADSPLSGIDGLSKGASLIFGHPQVALKTLARISEKYPAIVCTTGSISEKNYSSTKAGYKAAFNHSMSAVVVEIDDDGDFFIRHLNFDGKGFYDFENYYTSKSVKKIDNPIEAIAVGDEHAAFVDPDVRKATYDNKDSIVKVLKPKKIIRHDVLDFFSGSHHHKNDVFLKYAKHHSQGIWSVKSELDLTIDYINDTTPPNTTNLLVASNHTDHLKRWLNEYTTGDSENALLYHYLMYKMLENTKLDGQAFYCPEPFELYASDKMQENTLFLSRNESFRIKDVLISSHGDAGTNGSRGSPKQFASIPAKMIVGHSHSPSIEKGCYTLGTSSLLRMSYNKGSSTWDNCQCLIYNNGKRQMVFIRNGKWRV